MYESKPKVVLTPNVQEVTSITTFLIRGGLACAWGGGEGRDRQIPDKGAWTYDPLHQRLVTKSRLKKKKANNNQVHVKVLSNFLEQEKS